MIKAFKMFILEIKIRYYGSLFEHYKRKALKQQYFVNKLCEYTNKVNITEIDYKALINNKKEP
jgi:hypothetical protein